ncbi:MAG: hypothetical protein ABIH23_10845, partial [bacterium]
ESHFDGEEAADLLESMKGFFKDLHDSVIAEKGTPAGNEPISVGSSPLDHITKVKTKLRAKPKKAKISKVVIPGLPGQ